jgi:hypothetical protein
MRAWMNRLPRAGALKLCLVLLLLATAVATAACGASNSAGGNEGSSASETGGFSSTTVDGTRILSSDSAAPGQEWYECGRYMGYWAGNVETIPAQSGHLPNFFFAGPTPTASIRTDSDGNPIHLDPDNIAKPLWVFGDEVHLTDYYEQIRRAKEDNRPILFYATADTEACTALGVEQQSWSDAPLDRLIVRWVPWSGATLDTVDSWTWTEWPGASDPAHVFLMLVEATLNY